MLYPTAHLIAIAAPSPFNPKGISTFCPESDKGGGQTDYGLIKWQSTRPPKYFISAQSWPSFVNLRRYFWFFFLGLVPSAVQWKIWNSCLVRFLTSGGMGEDWEGLSSLAFPWRPELLPSALFWEKNDVGYSNNSGLRKNWFSFSSSWKLCV